MVALRSIPVRAAPEDEAEMVTEVVVGEMIEVVGGSSGWLEVVVPGHRTRLDSRGYPGWILSEATIQNDAWEPDVVVVGKNSADLPLGAPLEATEAGVRLPDGSELALEEDSIRPRKKPLESPPIETARSLLGLPYRWGGTDSTVGMDCSGMVYRAMQVCGMAVPRDADDQYEAAPFKSKEHWKMAQCGDLVFFGKESVTHVGFYLGDGRYLSESGEGEGTVVRRMDEDPYWGFARYC